jgi:hypothetical protein
MDKGNHFEIEDEISHPNRHACYLKHPSTKATFDSALERAQNWVASLTS